MNMRSVIILHHGKRPPEALARRIRDFSVFSEILPIQFSAEKIRKINPIGIILSRSDPLNPQTDMPLPDRDIYKLEIPILAVGNGALIMAHQLGGKVYFPERAESGLEEVSLSPDCPLFEKLEPVQQARFDSGVQIGNLPNGFKDIAASGSRGHAAFANESRKLYAALFSIEPDQTKFGKRILDRFLFQICGADGSFTLDKYLKKQIKEIKKAVGKEKIVLGLSGGVNSAVVAAILSAAVPNQLTCVVVDHGMMRKNEAAEIEKFFRGKSLNIIRVDASERFFKKLSAIETPNKKRKTIEEQYLKVFAKQADRIGGAKYLALGTIYPDLIRDGFDKIYPSKPQQFIRELPKESGFSEIIEPLRFLFKDEVRELGRMIGLPEEITRRPSFPAAGLSLRIFGSVTREKVKILQTADEIATQEFAETAPFSGRVTSMLTDLQAIAPEASHGGKYALILRFDPANDADEMNKPEQFLNEAYGRIASRTLREIGAINRVIRDVDTGMN